MMGRSEQKRRNRSPLEARKREVAPTPDGDHRGHPCGRPSQSPPRGNNMSMCALEGDGNVR
eukprot:8973335-Alexandrium_andersonii.AAC.1